MKSLSAPLFAALFVSWLGMQSYGNISLLCLFAFVLGVSLPYLYQKIWVSLCSDLRKRVEEFNHIQRRNDFYIWHYQFELWVDDFYKRKMLEVYCQKMSGLADEMMRRWRA